MGSTGAMEEAAGGGMAAVLDFDILCATVALQTRGLSAEKRRLEEEGEEAGDEEIGAELAGVQRMWEGDIVDCFDDRRIAIETACCPCYRFGKNMRRASLGSCFLQATVYLIFVAGALFNFIAFGVFRARLKKQFNIKGNGTLLDDCLNHLICPCCTLCQESRTLEMNNVQNGVWHGRGDTICLARGGEGSTTFIALRQPPLLAIRSPGHSSMERTTDDNQHSWSLDTSQSKPLVSVDQFNIVSSRD
ncbi:hypothetical protein ZIOFF_030132 [Zingiber officinale]|uniref:Uncharacterized protein n=1 Tax=Zingiber officinale TaxID=94328 RepID=A0A8J5GXS1_ZINOF|nr:hypothetical protein ZIOFF_030132 [Zingiber officinale]